MGEYPPPPTLDETLKLLCREVWLSIHVPKERGRKKKRMVLEPLSCNEIKVRLGRVMSWVDQYSYNVRNLISGILDKMCVTVKYYVLPDWGVYIIHKRERYVPDYIYEGYDPSSYTESVSIKPLPLYISDVIDEKIKEFTKLADETIKKIEEACSGC